MSLTQQLDQLVAEGWKDVFARKTSFQRAQAHAHAQSRIIGRHTISNAILALGGGQQDWSATYKFFSRSPWNEEQLFRPVIDQYLKRYQKGLIGIALDDTNISKTGKKIPGTQWRRDPLSPPFHVNLLYSLRFLQVSLLFPHDPMLQVGARAIPIRFKNSPSLKKPGKKASKDQKAAFKAEQKKNNLSVQAVEMMKNVRSEFDAAGAYNRILVFGVDGSYCNKNVFQQTLQRCIIIARVRKDARLCYPSADKRRFYSPDRFTPEEIRTNESIPYQAIKAFYGGCFRDIRIKEVSGLLWQRGSARQPVRLIVIAPQPYRPSPNSRIRYREAGFLLTKDLVTPVVALVQIYLDRWQIEVNHRDEKSVIRVGDAQVRSTLSVDRHPAFCVAIYSMILLASLCEYGPTRTHHYLPLPLWRKPSARPSTIDIISLLVSETHSDIHQHPSIVDDRASP